MKPNRLVSSGDALSNEELTSNIVLRDVNGECGLVVVDAWLTNANLGQVIFQGTNPEKIILPLELLRSQFFECLDSPSCSFVPNSLLKLVNNEWLRYGFEDLLCWGYRGLYSYKSYSATPGGKKGAWIKHQPNFLNRRTSQKYRVVNPQ